MGDKTAYPLCWPDGWPRSTDKHESAFGRGTAQGRHSMAKAVEFLQHELRLLVTDKEILSTNIKPNLSGVPVSGAAQPKDVGAAVYFELNGTPVSLACDKWNRVECNVWAIAKHIESLRGQERWGVGSIQRAFRGYMALPGVGESEASTWWRTLGVPINSTPEVVRQAYRILVKKHHPDKGGDRELFDRITRAMERFEATLAQR